MKRKKKKNLRLSWHICTYWAPASIFLTIYSVFKSILDNELRKRGVCCKPLQRFIQCITEWKSLKQGRTLLRDWHPVIAQGLSRRYPPPCWVLIQKLHAKDTEWLHEPPTVQTSGERKGRVWMELLQAVGSSAWLPGAPFTKAALAVVANGRLVRKHRKNVTVGRKWVNGGSSGSSRNSFCYINTHIVAPAVSGNDS